MATKQIDRARIQTLNDRDTEDGDYVLYWMASSQRTEWNHALEFAIQRANENQQPLHVCCVISPRLGIHSARQFQFVIEGLRHVATSLSRRDIAFSVHLADPEKTVLDLAAQASELVCDRDYLREPVAMRSHVASNAACKVWQVETNVIVPVSEAAQDREYAARTIRSQITAAADDYVRDLSTTAVEKGARDYEIPSADLSNPTSLMDQYSFSWEVPPVGWLSGGTSQAKAHLQRFIDQRLSHYTERKAVVEENVSYLSAYLHFGQISPLAVYQGIQECSADREAKEAFLEELLVRRELAVNFVHFEKEYDSLNSLPQWAYRSLMEHESDERPHHYTRSELEDAQTHDEAWNAMMIEMKDRGYLHNHLRMYWGKKIIHWTNTVGHAFRTAIELNNKYFLDGWDPNSYANVLWLFGLHDRAHAEREVFGKVRYMSSGGLDRKVDVERFVERVTQAADTYQQ